MRLNRIMITLAICTAGIGLLYAATSLQMKCHNKTCGFETRIAFGPTMTTEAINGYCRSCKDFVSLKWRYRSFDGSPDGIEKRPEAMGEVWDSKTGAITPIYGCPDCKSPFLEIKNHAELKHCPACNEAEFRVDKNAGIVESD